MNVEEMVSAVGVAPIALILVVARVSAFVVAAPGFGDNMLPNVVKLGLCLGLGMFWLPDYLPLAAEIRTQAGLVVTMSIELIAGLVIGYLVRLMMLPAHVAGSYLGQEIGFNLGQVTDPGSGAPANETGLIFDAFSLVLFWLTDVHHVALQALGKVSELVFIDRGMLRDLQHLSGRLISRAHENGLMIVAPVTSMLFITMVSVMILMRGWPQTTLFSFGLPMRLLVGLTSFLFFLPLILSNIAEVLEEAAVTITQAIVR